MSDGHVASPYGGGRDFLAGIETRATGAARVSLVVGSLERAQLSAVCAPSKYRSTVNWIFRRIPEREEKEDTDYIGDKCDTLSIKSPPGRRVQGTRDFFSCATWNICRCLIQQGLVRSRLDSGSASVTEGCSRRDPPFFPPNASLPFSPPYSLHPFVILPRSDTRLPFSRFFRGLHTPARINTNPVLIVPILVERPRKAFAKPRQRGGSAPLFTTTIIRRDAAPLLAEDG